MKAVKLKNGKIVFKGQKREGQGWSDGRYTRVVVKFMIKVKTKVVKEEKAKDGKTKQDEISPPISKNMARTDRRTDRRTNGHTHP